MKKNTKVTLIGLMMSVALGGSVPRAVAATCEKKSDTICPIKFGAKFDRCFGSSPFNPEPTTVGNAVCDALRDGDKVVKAIGKGANKWTGDVRKDMEDLVKVTLDGAVNPEAAEKFVAARNQAADIERDIRRLIKHPVCGVNGSLKAAQTALEKLGNHMASAIAIVPRLADAAQKAMPAAPEVAAAIAEMEALGRDLANEASAADKDRQALQAALDGLRADVGALGKLDTAGAAEAGARLASTVGPFVANANACVTAIVAAIKQAAESAGSAAATPEACPTTGGAACAVTIPTSVITGVGAALAGVISSGPCEAATADGARIGEHVDTIRRFVASGVGVAQSVGKNVERLQKGGEALVEIGQRLPSAVKARTDKIDASFDRAAEALDASLEILDREVGPRLAELAGNVLRQMSESVDHMTTCWDEAKDVAAQTGANVVEAFQLLTDASLNLVDGGRVMKNLEERGEAAVRAADTEAKRRFKAVESGYEDLHKDLWGVPLGKTDLGKTVEHLLKLGTNSSKVQKLAKSAAGFADDVGDLVTGSIEAGKKAFLDQDKLKIQSRAKFDEAERQARRALIVMAKAEAAARRKEAQTPRPPAVIPVLEMPTLPARVKRAAASPRVPGRED